MLILLSYRTFTVYLCHEGSANKVAGRAGTPSYTLFATAPAGQKQRGRANEPDFVGILLTLVRLEKQQTDVVIAINVPHVAGQYDKDSVSPETGANGMLLEAAIEYRAKVMESFELKDWGLFVQD